MSRKGQSGTIMTWVIFLIVFTILFLGLSFAINSYVGGKAATPSSLKAEFIALRFANIPECFAKEQSGTVFSGIIDLAKFTDEQLLSCYKTADIGDIATFNFRLVLEKEGSSVTTDQYYKHDDFTLYQEVLVAKDDELLKDRLIIYVQEEEVRG